MLLLYSCGHMSVIEQNIANYSTFFHLKRDGPAIQEKPADPTAS